jgi:hypothetical protein
MVIYQIARCHIPEDRNLYVQSREILRSHVIKENALSKA